MKFFLEHHPDEEFPWFVRYTSIEDALADWLRMLYDEDQMKKWLSWNGIPFADPKTNRQESDICFKMRTAEDAMTFIMRFG